MSEMILRAERMVRHSRRFYLRLCAFCDRPVGLATAPATGARCGEHAGELLRLGRERALTVGRPRGDECDRPDPDRPTRRTGRARRGAPRAALLVAAA